MWELANIPSSIRFQGWYPYFGDVFSNTSTTVCQATLNDYLADHLRYDTPTCYRHLDCVLGNTRQSTMAHLNSSSVVLGLLPTLLIMIGPSMAQLALLSSRRPILTFLLMLGSPVGAPDVRPRVETPAMSLDNRPGDIIVPPFRTRWATVISLCQYILALGAIANATHNSFELGNRTVLVWKCNAGFLPLLWTLAPAVIFVFICIPYQFTDVAKFLRKAAGALSGSNSSSSFSERWKLESTLSANQPRHEPEDLPLRTVKANILLNYGIGLGLFHMLAGIAIFSSLTFISVADALVVVGRYTLSATISRCILLFEVSSMKKFPEKCSSLPMFTKDMRVDSMESNNSKKALIVGRWVLRD